MKKALTGAARQAPISLSGRLPDFLAAPAIARGELVQVLPLVYPEAVDVHALYPSHRSLSAKVRVFIDVLAAYLKDRPLDRVAT